MEEKTEGGPVYSEFGMDESEWEAFLGEMLAGIRGGGELNWLHAPGLTTYTDDSRDARFKHLACLELEMREEIYREKDFSDAAEARDRRVVWKAKDER